jgi:uncharacterized membrane protein YfcA
MLENLTAINLALLGIAMFTAGFIDAIAGGGGLIQTPAMLLSFPDRNPVEVVATSKTAAFFGMVFPAFIGAGFGAHLASRISSESYKSSIFFVMIAIFIYTLVKPELGKNHVEKYAPGKLKVIGAIAAFFIGFYDGLIGPGTGTILMIALVAIMGFAFVGASAIAKVVNATTNLASIIVVGLTIGVMWKLALVLGVANLAGGYAGSHMALKKGSGFIRIFYLIVTGILILRLGYSLYFE